MAMNLVNESLVITIPTSEIIPASRLKSCGISDREVTGYYTNDDQNKKKAILDFFDQFEGEDYLKSSFYIDCEKMRQYSLDIKKYILPCRDIFRENMAGLEEKLEYFSSNDKHIPSMFLGGRDNRYLKFDNSDVVTKKFREILFDSITNLVIEKRNGDYFVYSTLRIDCLELLHENCNYSANGFEKQIVVDDMIRDLSIEELSEVLKDMYASPNLNGSTNAIRMFAIKYGEVISKNEYSLSKIISLAGLNQSYGVELNKGLSIYKSISENEFGLHFFDSFQRTVNIDAATGVNVILYGVPGCGKSHYISQNYPVDESNCERVVFHPDYTYSDFIGQILPDRDENGHICYVFKEGPFTRVLGKAIKEPQKDFYLIIEEINRGNAPAIFGDIFQLLDRDDNGNSVYKISNSEIAEIAYGDKAHFVSIPGNLTILATMNTADQNVFTLDTAFKRRWQMKCIPNDFDACPWANDIIANSNVTWRTFATTINQIIVENQSSSVSSEDKRLGAFFVKPSELKDVDAFSEKVLMYLWNDAFKYKHNVVFNYECETLESLIDAYKYGSFEAIFNDAVTFFEQEEILDKLEIDEYLSGKPARSVEFYNKITNKLEEAGKDFEVKIVEKSDYIRLSVPALRRRGVVFVEIHLNTDKPYVLTKPPMGIHNVGEKLSDRYGWSVDYKIYLEDSIFDKIMEVIFDSYDQISNS